MLLPFVGQASCLPTPLTMVPLPVDTGGNGVPETALRSLGEFAARTSRLSMNDNGAPRRAGSLDMPPRLAAYTLTRALDTGHAHLYNH